MKSSWSSYGNSYLRHLESSKKEGNLLTMDTQSQQELLLALEAIQIYVKRMNTGKARIKIQVGMISIDIENSREMLS